MSAAALALLAAAVAAGREAHRRRAPRPLLWTAGALAGVAVLTALGVGPLPIIAVLLVPVAALTAAPRLRRARRRARLEAQIPELAEHTADALASGLSITGALDSAAATIGPPLKGELERLCGALALGEPPERALEEFRRRIGDPALDLLVGVVAMQRRAGGDLSHALRTLSIRLGERRRLGREVRVATGQARMTGALVAALPAVAGIGIEVMRPGTLAGLLAGPALALAVLCGLIQAAGLVAIARIARVDRP